MKHWLVACGVSLVSSASTSYGMLSTPRSPDTSRHPQRSAVNLTTAFLMQTGLSFASLRIFVLVQEGLRDLKKEKPGEATDSYLNFPKYGTQEGQFLPRRSWMKAGASAVPTSARRRERYELEPLAVLHGTPFLDFQ